MPDILDASHSHHVQHRGNCFKTLLQKEDKSFSAEKLSAAVTAVSTLALPADHRPRPLEFRKGAPKLHVDRHRVGSSSAHQVMWEEEEEE